MAELDVANVAKLVGMRARERAYDALEMLEECTVPLYFIGQPGTSKTATAKAVAKRYAYLHSEYDEEGNFIRKCTPFYFQLGPDESKTTLMIGHRLVQGNLEIVKGVLAYAASLPGGAVVVIDEVTQSTNEVILLLNAFDGRESIISIGDEAIDASKVCIIYASNDSSNEGNIPVPPSLANRVYDIEFDYGDWQEEFEIAKAVALKESKSGIITVPDSVMKFITSYVREMRNPDTKNKKEPPCAYPLSVRNIAKAILAMNARAKAAKLNGVNGHIDPYFKTGSNKEAILKTIAKRVLNKELADVTAIGHPDVVEFIEFVSLISKDKFVQIIKRAMNVHLDIAGAGVGYDEHVQRLCSSIL